MESRTYIKNVKMSPKKLRFLAPEVRKLSPEVALDLLSYTTKKGARILHKAIKSAVSNGTSSLKVSADRLVFKTLTIEEGVKLKRFRAGGRGVAKPYVKQFAHIKIVLGTKEESKFEKKELKSEEIKDSKPKVKRERSKIPVRESQGKQVKSQKKTKKQNNF